VAIRVLSAEGKGTTIVRRRTGGMGVVRRGFGAEKAVRRQADDGFESDAVSLKFSISDRQSWLFE